MFDTFVNGKNRKRSFASLSLGFVINASMVVTLVLLPLLHPDTLTANLVDRFALPVPPKTPPADVKVFAAPKVQPRIERPPDVLYQPEAIPKDILILSEAEPSTGNGIPEGTPSDRRSCIVCDLFENNVQPEAIPKPAPPPPPPVPEPPKIQIIRVGGNVQAANLIEQIRPVYPPLAKQARIQGIVGLEATISKDGTITNLRVISGHPLLIGAAIDAVSQWRYKPTLLNGEPVEVVTTVTVNFAFAQ